MLQIEPPLRLKHLVREDARTATWRVTDPNGETRALRVLTVRAPDLRLRYAEAATALVGLSHPNLVNVVQVFEIDGKPAALTEHPPGRTLRAWLAEPRSLDHVMTAFVRVLRGVSALHRAGVVHGNLHCGCVIVSPGYEHQRPKLDDAVLGRRVGEGGVRRDLVAMGQILREMLAAVHPTTPHPLNALVAALSDTYREPPFATADALLEHLHRNPGLMALLPPSGRRTRLHRSGPTLLPDDVGLQVASVSPTSSRVLVSHPAASEFLHEVVELPAFASVGLVLAELAAGVLLVAALLLHLAA